MHNAGLGMYGLVAEHPKCLIDKTLNLAINLIPQCWLALVALAGASWDSCSSWYYACLLPCHGELHLSMVLWWQGVACHRVCSNGSSYSECSRGRGVWASLIVMLCQDLCASLHVSGCGVHSMNAPDTFWHACISTLSSQHSDGCGALSRLSSLIKAVMGAVQGSLENDDPNLAVGQKAAAHKPHSAGTFAAQASQVDEAIH